MAEEFNPDAYIAEEETFDPDQFLADVETEQPEQPSQLEAGLRGLGQGATLGLGDEIIGGIQAGAAKLTGSDESTLDLYRKYRDAQRAQEKAASDAHSGTYLAGELASAVIPGLGTIGLAAKGVKGAKAIQAAKTANAASIAKGIGTGAAIGGVAGAGTSEADLTQGEVAPLADDVKTGAAVGGVLGGSISALTKAGQAIKNTQFGEDIGRAFKLGKKGLSIKSGQFYDSVIKNIKRQGKNKAEKIGQAYKQASEVKNRIYKELGDMDEFQTQKFLDELDDRLKVAVEGKGDFKITVNEAAQIKKAFKDQFQLSPEKKIKSAYKESTEEVTRMTPQGEVKTITKREMAKDVPDEAEFLAMQQKSANFERQTGENLAAYGEKIENAADAVVPEQLAKNVSYKQMDNIVRNLQDAAKKLGEERQSSAQRALNNEIMGLRGLLNDSIKDSTKRQQVVDSNKLITLTNKIKTVFGDDKMNQSKLNKKVMDFIQNDWLKKKGSTSYQKDELLKAYEDAFGKQARDRFEKMSDRISKIHDMTRGVEEGKFGSAIQQFVTRYAHLPEVMANMAGYGLHMSKKNLKDMGVSKFVNNLTANQREGLVQKLNKMGKTKTANTMKKYMEAPSIRHRNMLSYVLIQNSTMKKDIEEALGEDEDERGSGQNPNETRRTNPDTIGY